METRIILPLIFLVVTALSGCVSHHVTKTHQISSNQAGENALKHGLSGGPLTMHTKPLTDFSLSGYKH